MRRERRMWKKWLVALVNAGLLGLLMRAFLYRWSVWSAIAETVTSSGVVLAYVWVLQETKKEAVSKWLDRALFGGGGVVTTMFLAMLVMVALAAPSLRVRCERPFGKITVSRVDSLKPGARSAATETIDCSTTDEKTLTLWGFEPRIRAVGSDGKRSTKTLSTLAANELVYPRDFALPPHFLVTLDRAAASLYEVELKQTLGKAKQGCAGNVTHCIRFDGLEGGPYEYPLGPNGVVFGAAVADESLRIEQAVALASKPAAPASAPAELVAGVKLQGTLLVRNPSTNAFDLCKIEEQTSDGVSRLWLFQDGSCP